ATVPLVVSGAITLSNSAVTIGGGTVTPAANSPIAFTGTMTLNGLNDTLTIANTAQTTLGGVIQEGTNAARALTLTKLAGAGTLVLNGSNTYTGQTNILFNGPANSAGGIVNIQNSSALGSTNSQLSPTTLANA